jgi:hypothetical protein
MLELFKWGGFPMYFVTGFGLIALGAAALFAATADRRRLGFVIGMSVATLFSTLNAIVADLCTVGHHINIGWNEYIADGGNAVIARIASQGFAESLSPGIFGFTLLSLTWLVASVGLRRAD